MTCVLRSGTWRSGTTTNVGRKTWFLAYTTDASQLTAAARKAKGSKRTELQRRARTVASRARAGDAACATTTTTTTTSTTTTIPSPVRLVKTVAGAPQTYDSDQNTQGFQFNPRYIPDAAQSFILDKPASLSSVSFWLKAVTFITPAQFEGEHTERIEYSGTVAISITTSIWKRTDDSALGATFDLSTGFTKLAETTSTDPIEIGAAGHLMTFPSAVDLPSGEYLVRFSWGREDPSILTLWIGGRQTGNHTMGGPLHDMVSNCDYTPSEDRYPRGRAYKNGSSGSISWTEFGTRSLEFVGALAKVPECVVVGSYVDIFNEGDLDIEIRGFWR